MKILTTVKKVVDVELNIHVEDGKIKEEGLQYVINAWDESGVEAAVQLKEQHGAETTAVSIGGGDNTEIIRRCYAMGIDKAMHVDDQGLEKADSPAYAQILKKVYEQGEYDLVITGKQAQDTDNGQTGIMLAEYLGLPCVSNVIKIEVLGDTQLKVSRAGDFGTEVVDVELPAVISVDVSINEPRLPSMRGIMMAKKKSFDQLDLAGIGASADEVGVTGPKSEVVAFLPSEKRQGGQKFEGDPAEITAKVVDLLANEAKVL
jgi:electron transfer flavoprotein beta subunit